MTEKKEKILEVALELFARQGYAVTSTSRIAKEAGVSEGLIFKHFVNKQGLLDAIVQNGMGDIERAINVCLRETNPKKSLAMSLDLALSLMREKKEFWQLTLSLKYQNPEIANKYHHNDIMKMLQTSLEDAFVKLDYQNPLAEAQLFGVLINSFFIQFIHEDNGQQESFLNFIKEKYKL
ncbi:MAG: TetR/AcrR family transcriptional regulator [Bacteroidales bacterium]|nr:TetR/AcrR family transcriptional regulator [Bacteroidales bacterium]